MQEYVSALVCQLDSYGAILQGTKVDSIYFGGGTPTLLSIEQFDELFSAIHKNLQFASPDIELCIEGCPKTVRESPEKIKSLKAFGVNRFSMGVQSFHDDELKDFGRSHRRDDVFYAVDILRASDIKFLNLDLIYGLKGQDRNKWISNLEVLVDLKPETATLYPLNIRKNTPLYEEMSNHEDDCNMFNLYDETVRFMRRHNYNHDTYVLFTKEGDVFGYKQQEKEFRGLPLLGIGIAARSYLDDFQYNSFDTGKCTNHSIKEYISQVKRNPFYAEKGIRLGLKQQMCRFVILGFLNFNYGVDISDFYRKFQQDPVEVFSAQFEWLLSQGLIQRTGKNLVFTERGRKFSNYIVGLFA